ncbi:cardiolipin synthase [Bacillaceae bacterium SIJ1]|uniref:cardiolipin synthase n=1 Tax=Litoribacterium kuwaitense TaxID=1398745 RepID=UPI0013ECB85C|nr:cardiolipin synthase [Litoribacterium kuwaitense]NGP46260.1 cardiolipin synthase [Litoribacterium kuwaitense]
MKQTRQVFLMLLLIASFFLGISDWVDDRERFISWLIYGFIIASICFAILLEGRNPYKTLLWIYTMIFFPIAGYALYLMTGQLEVKGHLFRQKRQDNRWYFDRLHNNKPRDTWQGLGETEKTISTFIQQTTKNDMSFYTNADILTNGEEKFPDLITNLKTAKHFIHLEYYIFRSDHIGTTIIDILCDKAEQGVDVRVIYDGIGSIQLKRKAIQRMKQSGVNIYAFLPLSEGLKTQKVNFRNHRKIVIIDGQTGYIGGLNIGDEYIGRSREFNFWRDTHVKIKGEAIQHLHTIFLMDWQYVSGEKLPIKQFISNEALLQESADGGVHIVSSGPDSEQGTMADIYFTMVTEARQSVWIATPYFIPNKAMRTALSTAASRGVDVRLMVPEKNDGFFTRYGTQSYFAELLSKGVDIYTYHKGFLHEKVIIVDENVASIGTANVDLRSFNLNFEANVFLFQSKAVATLVNDYQSDLNDCRQVISSEWKNRPFSMRVKESFSRLFSPVL